MVRAVALFVLAAGVSATLDASPFGNSVLAELETKLAAGTPLTELQSILNDIRDRLATADSADVAAQAADDIYCTQRTEKLNTDITLETNAIQSLNASINADEAVVKAKDAEMEQLTKEINQLVIDQANNEQQQRDALAEREDQNTEFMKGKADSYLCISAIDEIQQMPDLNRLRTNQGDNADMYQQGVRLTSMLESLATKVSHPQVQSFVQLAALTMASRLEGGDFDRLEELLQQLEDELNQYIEDIKADEAALLRQYLKLKADLEATHAHIVKTISEKRESFARASLAKDEAIDRITANTTEMNEAIASKAAVEAELRDLTNGCTARKAAHVERRAERVDEGKTIDRIEDILTSKLSKHFQEGGHLTANITSGN